MFGSPTDGALPRNRHGIPYVAPARPARACMNPRINRPKRRFYTMWQAEVYIGRLNPAMRGYFHAYGPCPEGHYHISSSPHARPRMGEKGTPTDGATESLRLVYEAEAQLDSDEE